jgi:adenylate cyclase
MPSLIYRPGTPHERRFELGIGLNSVGRNRDNQVWLNRADVSRRHAEIAVTPERVLLKDLGSSNHCYVNDRKVKLVELADGDEVRFSSVRLRFQAEDNPDSSAARRESAGDADASVAAVSSVRERARAAPLDGAESKAPAASMSAGSAAPESLLREPASWTGDRRLLRLKLLLEAANRLAEPSGVAVRMGKALDLVMQFLDVDQAAVLEQGPAGATQATPPVRVLAVRSRVGDAGGDGAVFHDPALVAASIAQGRPEVRVHEPLDVALGVHVACAVPLGPAAADAVLYVDSPSAPTRYADADIELIADLAAQFGIALANARALDALRADDGDLAGFDAIESGPSSAEPPPVSIVDGPSDLS